MRKQWKVCVQVPKSLHQRLVVEAAKEGVSLIYDI
ncbi:toxin-antitoxin system HicB family antitoxin [Kroppenstedtia pulmonis]